MRRPRQSMKILLRTFTVRAKRPSPRRPCGPQTDHRHRGIDRIRADARQTRRVVGAEDDLVIAAVTVAELRTGIELATEPRRAARSEFLRRVLETLPVEPFDLGTAEAHGRLLAHVHRRGKKRVAHDLIIAVTALATNRAVLTGDRKHTSATYQALSASRSVE